MKRFWALVWLLSVSLAGFAQCGGDAAAKKVDPSAVDRSSRLYFVFLNRPANAPTYSKEKAEEIQEGHMANIRRLGAEGKLMLAGPFMDDTTMRGIFVFKASSVDEVKQWLATDPAVKAGRLEGDIHPWQLGRGKIQDVTEVPAKVSMESFVMLIYRWGDKAKTATAEEKQAAFTGHMKYQIGLYDAKTTEIGGPFTDAESSPFVGVVIAHGKKEDGEKLGAEDPVVKAGIAKVEAHEWITAKGVLRH